MKKNALQYLLPMIAGITVFCTACGSGANSSDKEVPKNPSGDTSAEDADTESMTTAELVDAIFRASIRNGRNCIRSVNSGVSESL